MSVCVSVCARACVCLAFVVSVDGKGKNKLRHQVGKSDRSALSLCQKKESREATAKINRSERIFMVGDGREDVTVTVN